MSTHTMGWSHAKRSTQLFLSCTDRSFGDLCDDGDRFGRVWLGFATPPVLASFWLQYVKYQLYLVLSISGEVHGIYLDVFKLKPNNIAVVTGA